MPYVQHSTANPLGQRPWNSRLNGLAGSSRRLHGMDFYLQNTFPIPTTGQGPFLLNAGVTGGPMRNGGVPTLGAYMSAPNVAPPDPTSYVSPLAEVLGTNTAPVAASAPQGPSTETLLLGGAAIVGALWYFSKKR